MRNVLIAVATSAALAVASPALAEPIEFPAPPGVTFDNPQSWGNGRPKWSDILDFAFDCENGDEITVSHQRGLVTFEKSGSEYKIDGTDAHYQNVPDRFGNQQEAIVIGLIEGGPSTHPTWELAGDGPGGGPWYFSEQQGTRQMLKCLPR
jgi:hypothetical protein